MHFGPLFFLPNHLASTSASLRLGTLQLESYRTLPRKAMKENKNGSRIIEFYGVTCNVHNFQGSIFFLFFFFNYPKGSALEICQQPG